MRRLRTAWWNLTRHHARREFVISAHDGYPRWIGSGADFIEIDIRRAAGGEIVLAHDEVDPGARYQTLKEVLEAACGRIGLQLDLKEAGYEIQLLRMALKKCRADRVVVTTENPESARLIKAHFPHVRIGITARDVIATGADFTPLEHRHATNEALDFCARMGIPVWIWTVDDKRQMRRLIRDPRVSGIITNRPDVALKLR